MVAAWVEKEMKDVNLADKRLNSRMAQILDQLGGHPNASIPAACNGWAETMAAYRFFDNPRISFEKLLEPHIEATFSRIKEQSVVVLAHDTTEIDLTRPERKVAGAGPLDDGSRLGAMLHPLMGFTPDGTPLGVVYAEVWTREESPPSMTKREKEYARKHTPIEEKESVRWCETLLQGAAVAEHAPETQCVCVADSESDIYEVLELGQQSSVDWIVRACQDRALAIPENTEKTAPQPSPHLWEQLFLTKPLFTKEIHVRGRKPKVPIDKRKRKQPRDSRDATVEVRAAAVELRAPWRHDRELNNISVNVVLVSEVDPPKDDVPIQWMLLTSLPIEEVEQVKTVIQYYSLRWMIEVYFRTLKSSCRVEERQFETIDRMLNSLAIYMIVAWRALMICRIAREYPDISCEAIFEAEEWKPVFCVVRQQPPPDKPPTLQTMVRMMGQLGGYIDRVRTDEPGPQTVALGLQRAHDMAKCWLAFGPETRNQPTCV